MIVLMIMNNVLYYKICGLFHSYFQHTLGLRFDLIDLYSLFILCIVLLSPYGRKISLTLCLNNIFGEKRKGGKGKGSKGRETEGK